MQKTECRVNECWKGVLKELNSAEWNPHLVKCAEVLVIVECYMKDADLWKLFKHCVNFGERRKVREHAEQNGKCVERSVTCFTIELFEF